MGHGSNLRKAERVLSRVLPLFFALFAAIAFASHRAGLPFYLFGVVSFCASIALIVLDHKGKLSAHTIEDVDLVNQLLARLPPEFVVVRHPRVRGNRLRGTAVALAPNAIFVIEVKDWQGRVHFDRKLGKLMNGETDRGAEVEAACALAASVEADLARHSLEASVVPMLVIAGNGVKNGQERVNEVIVVSATYLVPCLATFRGKSRISASDVVDIAILLGK